jgi:hypothetical protein
MGALALGLGLLGAAAGPAAAQTFLDGFEDVPLAPQLQTVAGAGMVFDSPAGRIVESFATGSTDRAAVIAFYSETMPALGWTVQGPTQYAREGERLTIDFFGGDGALSVRFTLAPE